MHLHKRLEELYYEYNASGKCDDPVNYPRTFRKKGDIECAAFIAAVLSYGNIQQIRNSLEKINEALGSSPAEFLGNTSRGSKLPLFAHRFYTPDDLRVLLSVIGRVIRERGSLLALFLKNYRAGMPMKTALECFSAELTGYASAAEGKLSAGVKFMFPAPSGGSACKRMNLFMRWMVRRDNVDFGIWREVPPSSLIIPVDTHIARVSREVGFTSRKNVSWQMAEEITAALRVFDADDPIKYDFALCHLGISGGRV